MECEPVIPVDVLDDLCSRFVINVPDEERRDLIRICFQIESAHWFYIDFYSKNFPNRKPCGLREFALQVFKHIPFLQPYVKNLDKIIEDWKDYKFCVPTFGAILLDEDLSRVLLVQSYKSSWGFPKGKVNKDEPPYQCAIREVYEETGFDISQLIDTNDYVEANINEQMVRLYIIPGVKKNEKFIPKTRNEIKAVNWFSIYDIPLNKKDAVLMKQIKSGSGMYNTFYMVSPFLRKIRQWIYENKIKPRREQLKTLRQRNRSCSDMDSILYRGRNLNFEESVEMLRSYKSSEGDVSPKIDETNDDLNKAEVISRIVDEKSADGRELRLLLLSQELCCKSDMKFPLPAIREAVNPIADVPHTAELNTKALKTMLKMITNEENDEKRENTQVVPCSSLDSGLVSSAPKSTIPVSKESAFTKVEKSARQSRRKRWKRHNKRNEESSHTAEGNGSENKINIKDVRKTQDIKKEQSPLDFTPIQEIPGWVDFKFDISRILKAMNDAVLPKDNEK